MPKQIILIMGILVGGVMGALYSSIHAFASIKMKADQIISATALNLFAPAVAVFVARSVSSDGGQQIGFKSNFIVNEIPVLSKIPVIGDIFFKQAFLTTYLFFILAIIVAIVLNKTRFGLRLRACGENPHAADSLGVNIYKIRYQAVLLSGFFAGMGGVIFVASTSNEFNVSVGGFGFLAIAVLIFGNWKPSRVFLAAIFFGAIRTLASSYSGFDVLRNLDLDYRIYEMIPFILTLVVLAFFSKKSRAPKALGQIYDQGKR
jgi:simple sugar transport system permease protein